MYSLDSSQSINRFSLSCLHVDGWYPSSPRVVSYVNNCINSDCQAFVPAAGSTEKEARFRGQDGGRTASEERRDRRQTVEDVSTAATREEAAKTE